MRRSTPPLRSSLCRRLCFQARTQSNGEHSTQSWSGAWSELRLIKWTRMRFHSCRRLISFLVHRQCEKGWSKRPPFPAPATCDGHSEKKKSKVVINWRPSCVKKFFFHRTFDVFLPFLVQGCQISTVSVCWANTVG